MNKNLICNDTQHWANLKPPLAPNEDEIKIYKRLIGNKSPVCLLGMTKELVPLCDVAVDLVTRDIGKPTICCDWNDLTGNYGVIIGDGILNFTGMDFVNKALQLAPTLICRVFMKKQQGMKYATLFPTVFPGSKIIFNTQEDIVIVGWGIIE